MWNIWQRLAGVCFSCLALHHSYFIIFLLSLWHKHCYDCISFTTFTPNQHLIPLSQGIISSSVQLFYAWRVKVVTGNMWIVLFIVVCAIIDLRELFFTTNSCLALVDFLLPVAAIGTSIAISILPVFADAVKFKAIIVIWWGLLTISALTLSNIIFIKARFCRRCRCVHYNITHLPSGTFN